MKYMFITDQPDVAAFVSRSGVQRIFLDLEVLGKVARQGNRDTVISRHDRRNIGAVKSALRNSDLLVRTNPLHPESAREIDDCVASGADILMVPMCRSAEQVAEYCGLVRRRVPVCPLIETAGALADLPRILTIPGVTEIHVGLNDLHLELGCRFMLELVANGLMDEVAARSQLARIPFGIGGIASLTAGKVPGAMLLAEYVRLGSQAVILSREFSRRATTVEELRNNAGFPEELGKMESERLRLLSRTNAEVAWDRAKFRDFVFEVAGGARAA